MQTDVTDTHSFYPNGEKKKWAQKMQNHLLTQLLSKIHAQLGFSFQNSVECLPLRVTSIHWTQRENRAICKARGTLCFPHTLCDILSMVFLDLTDKIGTRGAHRGHAVLGSCPVVLSTKEKSFLRNRSSSSVV